MAGYAKVVSRLVRDEDGLTLTKIFAETRHSQKNSLIDTTAQSELQVEWNGHDSEADTLSVPTRRRVRLMDT